MMQKSESVFWWLVIAAGAYVLLFSGRLPLPPSRAGAQTAPPTVAQKSATAPRAVGGSCGAGGGGCGCGGGGRINNPPGI